MFTGIENVSNKFILENVIHNFHRGRGNWFPGDNVAEA
jgi:hypothetical protein